MTAGRISALLPPETLSDAYGIPQDAAQTFSELFRHDILRDLWRFGDQMRRNALQSLPDSALALLNRTETIALVKTATLLPSMFAAINTENQHILCPPIVSALMGIQEQRHTWTAKSMNYGDIRRNFARGGVPLLGTAYVLEEEYPFSHTDRQAMLQSLISAPAPQLQAFLTPLPAISEGESSTYPAIELVRRGHALDDTLETSPEDLRKIYLEIKDQPRLTRFDPTPEIFPPELS